MRIVLQRVSSAEVRVDGERVAEIGAGYVVLLGVAREDAEAHAERLARKIVSLRLFEDDDGRFGRTLRDVGGAALVVSQFTLLGDTAKGTRPSFSAAAPPEEAEPLYLAFCEALRAEGVEVETGVFGARMEIELANDGPVTLILER